MATPPRPLLALSRDALLAELSATPAGLTDDEAAARLALHGTNELERPVRRRLVLQLLRHLVDPLVAILIVAAIVSALAGEQRSAVLVLLIVIASVVIETVQSRRAQRTADALRATVAPTATVVRAGVVRTIARRELVPGDVLELDAGDLVPADARLIEAKDLHLHQAALTGESMPVERTAIAEALASVSPADGDGVVFAGTSIVSGRGRAVVVTTGRATMFGEIAAQLAAKPRPTEFDRGVAKFGVLIVETVVLLLVIVLGSAIVLHRDPLQALLFGVALAVGLTPEFLPMITTVTLATAASHMARRHVIVKQLGAIQNLGSIDVLCTDKTGTITVGEMALARWVDARGATDDRVRELAYAHAYFETGVGNAIDIALRCCRQGKPPYEHVDEIPFDFERRCASVVVADARGPLLIAKGAPEQLLARCALADAARTAALAVADELSADGSRVIAIATRRVPPQPAYRIADERDLELAGFLAFSDPPAPEIAKTIEALRADGVEVKILTGDAERVARAVCAQAGIAIRDVLSGAEIERMTDPALAERALRTDIFARVTPMQKHRIIGALASRGKVVGYLGDGINDAPSLRAADVGISVAGAVDIAREAADIVLTERDLRVLHAGIVEGRRALGNVMKYLLMETSSNFGNMLSMAVAAVVLPFLPMLPVQVLLNNFLYDLAQLTIPTDHVDPEFLRKPRRWQIDEVRRFMLRIGPISSIFDLVTFGALLWLFHASEALFHTGWFVESVLTQILVLFVIRRLGTGKAIAPSRALVASALTVVAVAVVLPFSPLAGVLGFVRLPIVLLAFIAATIGAYLALVHVVRARTHVLRDRPRGTSHALRAAMRSSLLVLFAVAACQTAEGGEPQKPSERFEHDMMVRFHMHENFGLLRTIEQLLVHGKLDAARAFAQAIASAPDEPGLQPFDKRAMAVRARAADLANAATIEEACKREAKLGAACADCHIDAGVLPEFTPAPREPPDEPTIQARMIRHLWASERLWEGLVGNSEDAWHAGLDVLAATPLPFGDKGDGGRASLARQLQRLAATAKQGRPYDQLRDRAQWYGEILATCAGCHAIR